MSSFPGTATRWRLLLCSAALRAQWLVCQVISIFRTKDRKVVEKYRTMALMALKWKDMEQLIKIGQQIHMDICPAAGQKIHAFPHWVVQRLPRWKMPSAKTSICGDVTAVTTAVSMALGRWTNERWGYAREEQGLSRNFCMDPPASPDRSFDQQTWQHCLSALFSKHCQMPKFPPFSSKYSMSCCFHMWLVSTMYL